MKRTARRCLLLLPLLALTLAAGCAAPGPYYSVQEQPAVQTGGPPAAGAGGYLMVGPADRRYVLRISDSTPFGLGNLPQTSNTLYQKGYDQVERERKADFALDVAFYAMTRDNPEARAANTVGGALLGAATGAIIGGALGSPGSGAAIGAGSGAALGLVTPVAAPMVRIDIRTQSFRDSTGSSMSATVDLANVPPYDVPRVVDTQVARMLESLPSK